MIKMTTNAILLHTNFSRINCFIEDNHSLIAANTPGGGFLYPLFLFPYNDPSIAIAAYMLGENDYTFDVELMPSLDLPLIKTRRSIA